jgi:hypothetical protein
MRADSASDANRVEYCLIDDAGHLYDFHRENRFFRSGDRSILESGKQGLAQQVRDACEGGEGLHVEFKPFINPSDKLSRSEGTGKRAKDKTKLGEAIETVAAFANTKGGHIYIGVNDDCTVSGIDHELREWAKAPRGEATIKRYLGGPQEQDQRELGRRGYVRSFTYRDR